MFGSFKLNELVREHTVREHIIKPIREHINKLVREQIIFKIYIKINKIIKIYNIIILLLSNNKRVLNEF